VTAAADSTGRKAAASAVTEVVAINFPQVPKPLIETFTNCTIENAAAVEVRELAKASVVGVDDLTVATVRAVLARPATQTCLRDRAPITL
jgi:UDP-N-acetylglucosamine:LPS N-acetylglucosamine transferase